jgi:orotate phosphoribosyltransferase
LSIIDVGSCQERADAGAYSFRAGGSEIVVEGFNAIIYDKFMKPYKMQFARTLAETGALFFDENLILKDGRPTPYFVNMATFRTGRLSLQLGALFAEMMVSKDLVERTDIVLGPSYKGSAIALATSISLWKDFEIEMPFEYDRKEAKTHGEASAVKSLFVNQTLFDACRIFVVDDVATSMGTKYELLAKITSHAKALGHSYHVTGVGIGIDREQTTAVRDERGQVMAERKGENAIQKFASETGIGVYSVAGIREVVSYLYAEKIPVTIQGKKRPIDEDTRAKFDAYLKTYGIG